ncbi:putative ribonuclease H-like domain-containing protein [Tanacetum coccineum]
MNQFCEMKSILRQFSVSRTPQQNGVAERRNRTLIEAARTMLADSKLLTTFWIEAVNTACYVQNRVLVVKPHNKTPYELFYGRTPTLSFMRPFGCPITILITIDHLGKCDGKVDEGFFVGYSLNSKAFRVFNSRTRIMEENLHIRFSENTPNVIGTKSSDNAGQARKETEPVKYYILLPLWTANLPFSQDPKSSHDDRSKTSSNDEKKVDEDLRNDSEYKDQEKEDNVNNTNNVNAASTNEVNAVGGKTSIELPFDPNMPALEDYNILDFSRDNEDDDAMADMKNLDTKIQVSPNLTTRIHKDHPLDQVIRDLESATHTRKLSKNLEEHGKNPKRIEAIRLFLAYASFKDFVVYQMDVKSAFLYGKIEEEVYVCQPPGFEDPDFPDRVYKVEKALYGLHQAPRAWYETLSTYLLDNGFQRGKIDKTLFIKRHKGDILLVQVYVDDIIFGSTKKELCIAFEKLMHEKFQMSSMGELTFFLGLQVKQKKDGIFISQDKYVAEILKKFGFTEVKTASTPIETQKPLLKDGDGEELYVYIYRSMIGSLMYLTSSRPDIMFVVCACARYQVNLKVSHLHVVKRIFSLDKKSPTGGWSILGYRLISWQCKKRHGCKFHNKLNGKKIIITESIVRRDLRLEDAEGVDCLPNATIFKQLALIGGDSLVRATTTASSLEAEQVSGGVPRRQDTMGDTIAQTLFENVSKLSNDLLLARGNTLQSGEDRLKLEELMELCQEARKEWKGRINDIDEDEDITLISVQDDTDAEMFDVNTLTGEEVVVVEEINERRDVVDEVADVIKTAQVSTSTKPKAKGITFRESGESITITTPILAKVQDKGKGILFDEEERLAGEKDKANVALTKEWDDIQAKIEADHELAKKLQGEEQEELSGAEKATLFIQLLKKRRKYFAAKSVEEKRNKPSTQAQQRKIMCTYLKNMEGKKPKDLKNKSFDSIQKMFNRAFKKETAERNDDQEAAKIKDLMKIVPDKDELAIDAIPLATKSPRIVDWKIYKEGKKSYY